VWFYIPTAKEQRNKSKEGLVSCDILHALKGVASKQCLAPEVFFNNLSFSHELNAVSNSV